MRLYTCIYYCEFYVKRSYINLCLVSLQENGFRLHKVYILMCTDVYDIAQYYCHKCIFLELLLHENIEKP